MISKINKCKREASVVTFTKPTFSVSILIAEKLCSSIDCQFSTDHTEQRLRLSRVFMLNNTDIMVCYILVLYIIGSH